MHGCSYVATGLFDLPYIVDLHVINNYTATQVSLLGIVLKWLKAIKLFPCLYSVCYFDILVYVCT